METLTGATLVATHGWACLPEVDYYAKKFGMSRAEAIHHMVEEWLWERRT